jgi:hypothetical protein
MTREESEAVDEEWVLDTGASSHMTRNRNALFDETSYSTNISCSLPSKNSERSTLNWKDSIQQ